METIGFIGLGLMGRPMAEHLLQAGYPLVVHNRSQAAVDALVAQGARAADSPREVAEQCDVVITMLPDPQTVARVIDGEDGVLSGARRGALVIDMSTSHPQLARDLAERAAAQDVSMLDAPVSGGQVGAQQGTISIMVGGEEAAFERALPLFKAMGKNIARVGSAGAGQIVKAANQIIVALTMEAIAEALSFIEKSGVDAARAREVMMGGFATSRVLELHGKRMVDRNFAPGANAWMHLKDLDIALDMAKSNGANLPATAHVAGMYRELIERGFGNDDHSAVWRVVAEDWS